MTEQDLWAACEELAREAVRHQEEKLQLLRSELPFMEKAKGLQAANRAIADLLVMDGAVFARYVHEMAAAASRPPIDA